MAVEVRVAVTRKVLATGKDSPVMQPVGKRQRMLDDDFWRVAKCAITDHGIVGVGVHVENRREVQVDADGTQLSPEDHPGVACELCVSGRCEDPHRRQRKHRPAETRNAPAFLIDADQYWKRGTPSSDARGDQRNGLLHLMDVALEKDQTRYGLLRQPPVNRCGRFQAIESADDHAARHSLELVHFLRKP